MPERSLPSDELWCSSCGHALADHVDSWEWREEVHMRTCRATGCRCRRFWERDAEPPA